MATVPRTTYRINVIPNKLFMIFFIKLDQIIVRFMWNQKRPRIAKTVLREKNKAGGITLSDFQQYYKAAVIKTVWF